MKGLFDQLIGDMRAVEVARVDVIHAAGDGLPQNSERSGNIARRSPHNLVAFLAGKLHRAIAHAVHRNGSVGKAECTSKS